MRVKKFLIIVAVIVVVIGIVGTTTWVGSGHAKLPLILVPVVWLDQAMNPEEVASIGESLSKDSQASTHSISERFETKELQKVFEVLNSEAFQSPLTNYNCGDPVPPFKFKVTLYRTSRAHAGARRVEWRHSPAIDFAGRGRCLEFGLSYSVDKAFARIDPDPGAAGHDPMIRSPHCDCSKRDGNEEWVTWPGPDEKLW